MDDRQLYVVQSLNLMDISIPTPIPSQLIEPFENIVHKFSDYKDYTKNLTSSNAALSEKNRQLMEEIDRRKETEEEAVSEIKRLHQVISNTSLRHKEEKDKIIQEREDLKKEIVKMSSREVQYQHEIKKYQGDYSKLKEKYSRAIVDKESCKNSIELSYNLEMSIKESSEHLSLIHI